MDFVEASNIDLMKESAHWWIRTRFKYVDLALENINSNEIKVLEVGCGTGQNLSYLRNESIHKERISQLVGIDLNLPENFKRPDLGDRDQLLSSPNNLEKDYDLLLLMDVIEHVEDPVGLINSYKGFLKKEGRILITVPAFQSLWSQHDVILEHVKRYDLDLLNEETALCHLKPRFTGYIFALFFPIVFILRKLLPDNKKVETDLKLPNPLINGLCLFLGTLERKMGNPLPFGTSVVGVYELSE